MDEREFEQMVERLMKLDFSVGTEAFRDRLLARCLAALREGFELRELTNNELDLLAAAGEGFVLGEAGMDSRGIIGDNKDANNLP